MRCNPLRMKLYELSFSVGAETAFEGVTAHVFSPTGAAPFLQDEHGVEQPAISAANPTDNATVFLIPHFFINPPLEGLVDSKRCNPSLGVRSAGKKWLCYGEMGACYLRPVPQRR